MDVSMDRAEFVMGTLEKMSGMDLNQELRTKAKEIILANAAPNQELSVLDVVNYFDQIQELTLFASRLREFAVPGKFAHVFK